jgi:hypothetical protein
LIVEAVSITPDGVDNPKAVRVAAGTQVIVKVEMPVGSTNSQSFMVHTSISLL